MKNFKHKYKGFTISMDQISDSKVEYRIIHPEGYVVEDTEGFSVTIQQAIDACKDTIDDL